MNNSDLQTRLKTPIVLVSLSVVITALVVGFAASFFCEKEQVKQEAMMLPAAPDFSEYIAIKKGDAPQINYAPVLYREDELWTEEKQELLYEGAIKPFLMRMQSEGYDVIAIEIGWPWDNPLSMEAILHQKATGIFSAYQAEAIKEDNGTFRYIPDAPPGYAG